MSRRTSQANKAIAEAWEKERNNILEGKGTREWTIEQQRDILERGKAYDDNGVAFQGQHMKSVCKYPEYQGDSGNIQFLSKEEHLKAHMGSWQNPTNWYYDPVTKEMFDFGTNPYTPCNVFELKESIVRIETTTTMDHSSEVKIKDDNLSSNNKKANSPTGSHQKAIATTKASARVTQVNSSVVRKVRHFFQRGGGFVYKHRGIIIKGLKIGGPIVGGIILDRVTSGESSFGGGNKDGTYNNYFSSEGNKSFERVSPNEHVVSGHSQRYHTRSGVKTIEKNPYSRGGRKGK